MIKYSNWYNLYVQVRFDWDRNNLRKIAAHGIARHEVEEALRGRHRNVGKEVRSGETRYSTVGKTKAGRTLKIITARRQGKIRVVSAWESRGDRSLL